jgi:hypothetical protein
MGWVAPHEVAASHDPPEVTGEDSTDSVRVGSGVVPEPCAEEEDSPEEPDSLAEELDSVADDEDGDSCAEALDSCAPVDGVVADSGVFASEAEVGCSVVLACGVWAGAVSVEGLVEVPLEPEPSARCAPPRAFVACVSLSVLPGKALAATAVSAPVRVALPAISQRLARASRRSAASRERGVCGLSGIAIEESMLQVQCAPG